MTWVEYLEWMEVYKMQPWGCIVDDDRFARLINVQLTKPLTTRELFPRGPQDVKQKDDTASMEAKLRAAFMEHNAILDAKGQAQP